MKKGEVPGLKGWGCGPWTVVYVPERNSYYVQTCKVFKGLWEGKNAISAVMSKTYSEGKGEGYFLNIHQAKEADSVALGHNKGGMPSYWLDTQQVTDFLWYCATKLKPSLRKVDAYRALEAAIKKRFEEHVPQVQKEPSREIPKEEGARWFTQVRTEAASLVLQQYHELLERRVEEYIQRRVKELDQEAKRRRVEKKR